MKKTFMAIVFSLIILCSISFVACDSSDSGIYKITISKNIKHGLIVCELKESKSGENVYVYSKSDIGYVLDGIYINGDRIDGNRFVMPKKNVTIFADFDLIQYTIKYMSYGAENYNTTFSYNIETEDFELKPAYMPNNYFLGWYTDSAHKNKIKKITKGTTGDITLYAWFVPINMV